MVWWGGKCERVNWEVAGLFDVWMKLGGLFVDTSGKGFF